VDTLSAMFEALLDCLDSVSYDKTNVHTLFYETTEVQQKTSQFEVFCTNCCEVFCKEQTTQLNALMTETRNTAPFPPFHFDDCIIEY
jgi:hypothetical protein